MIGVFKDNAMNYIRNVIPPPSMHAEDTALDAAVEYLLSNGITSVHHMGTWNDLATFQRAKNASRLNIRYNYNNH